VDGARGVRPVPAGFLTDAIGVPQEWMMSEGGGKKHTCFSRVAVDSTRIRSGRRC